MKMIADKCDRCGKVVVKQNHFDSSDMVITEGSFLYMCDRKGGKACRPHLELESLSGIRGERGKAYCPDCLLAVVREWVEEIKKRGASDIPVGNIILPEAVGE